MQRSATFTVAGSRAVVGQLVERDGALSFEARDGTVYPEDVLRDGGIVLVAPSDGSSPPDLVALRGLCQKRRIAVGIGRARTS